MAIEEAFWPRPPVLSFETLRISERERDREIDRRIREATRLPTKLPPHIVQDIELMRAKCGVAATFGREAIKDIDMARLNPQGPDQWLNDEVINIYGAILLDRAEKYMANKKILVNGAAKKRKGKAPEFLNIHYFNTYLYPKVPKYDVFRLNRWTKKVDIFSKDYVFIPVNHGNVHWTLSAINFRKKRIEAYDSMGHYRPEVYKTLRNYLDLEHRDKKMKPFDFTDWVDHFDEDIPKQENGYDCGVFTCQFMESLSRGVEEFAFDQSDMVYIRNRMTWEIGKGKMWEDSDG
ncbi:cysteine proteinase [Hysterangium stoloniferum]|nr:cysteine proteinase [Hysterangium stoloniferum]